ncbi:conserved domain protein, partial [Paraprevotella xylaniphila YIT 11841]
KFTLKHWYRGRLKDANLSGQKTVCGKLVRGEHPPENIHASFLPGIRYSKARKMDVCIAENRSQRIEKSFAAERKIVWRRMYGRFCILLGNSFR